jgi:putative ABC transport system substrate-binding protein
MPVIGFLNSTSLDGYRPMLNAFRQGLQESGYIEGRNVAIEYRWAEGRNDRLSAMAAELVRRQVTVIAAMNTASVLATRGATTTIPVVFYTGTDPVQLGLVTSLSRPGGNLTGVVTLNVELVAKRLELLQELVPAASLIAVLVNPTDSNVETTLRSLRAAARDLRLQLHVLRASTEREIDDAFAVLSQLKAGGVVIGSDVFFNTRSEQLGALASRHGVAAIYQYRAFALAGGLMSYSGDIAESHRLAGGYTAQILKGEKPADLPVQQATKVELIINLKTAKALGLTIPLPLIGRADEVIECSGASSSRCSAARRQQHGHWRRGRNRRENCRTLGSWARPRVRAVANGSRLLCSDCTNSGGTRVAPSRSSIAGPRDAKSASPRSRPSSSGSRSMSLSRGQAPQPSRQGRRQW